MSNRILLVLITAGRCRVLLIVSTEFVTFFKRKSACSSQKKAKTITQMCLECSICGLPDGLHPPDTCTHLVRLQAVLQTIQADRPTAEWVKDPSEVWMRPSECDKHRLTGTKSGIPERFKDHYASLPTRYWHRRVKNSFFLKEFSLFYPSKPLRVVLCYALISNFKSADWWTNSVQKSA